MKMKKFLLSATALVAGLALGACSSSSSNETAEDTSLSDIQDKGTLVVATSPDYAPFEFQTLVDGENQIVGSDILLAQKIADELGVELEISSMSFDNVLNSVQSGKADIAIAGLTISEEREEVFDFSISYFDVANVVLVLDSEKDNYTSVDDLAGIDVAVQKGTTQEVYVNENLTDSNIVSLTAMGEAINELKSGKVKAVILDESVAEGYLAQNSDLAIADIELGDDSEANTKAVAMKKGSTALKAKIDEIITEVVENGEYEQYLEEAAQYTVVEE